MGCSDQIDAVHDEVYIYGKNGFLIQVTNDTFILLILLSLTQDPGSRLQTLDQLSRSKPLECNLVNFLK
jgi:hypothetical protein